MTIILRVGFCLTTENLQPHQNLRFLSGAPTPTAIGELVHRGGLPAILGLQFLHSHPITQPYQIHHLKFAQITYAHNGNQLFPIIKQINNTLINLI